MEVVVMGVYLQGIVADKEKNTRRTHTRSGITIKIKYESVREYFYF